MGNNPITTPLPKIYSLVGYCTRKSKTTAPRIIRSVIDEYRQVGDRTYSNPAVRRVAREV